MYYVGDSETYFWNAHIIIRADLVFFFLVKTVKHVGEAEKFIAFLC